MNVILQVQNPVHIAHGRRSAGARWRPYRSWTPLRGCMVMFLPLMDVVGRPPVAPMALTEGDAEVANGVRIAHGRLSAVAIRRPWSSGRAGRTCEGRSPSSQRASASSLGAQASCLVWGRGASPPSLGDEEPARRPRSQRPSLRDEEPARRRFPLLYPALGLSPARKRGPATRRSWQAGGRKSARAYLRPGRFTRLPVGSGCVHRWAWADCHERRRTMIVLLRNLLAPLSPTRSWISAPAISQPPARGWDELTLALEIKRAST